MALLPLGLFPKLELLLIAVGLAVILRKGMPKAYGFGVLMLAAFALDILSNLAGHGATQPEMGFVAARFFAGEAWWSPVTSIFTHAPAGGRMFSLFNLHVVGNLLILVTAGPALEDRVGEKKFLVIFFTAAFAALAVHTLLAYTTDITSPYALALGASGAIFGVLTAFAVRYPKEKLPIILFFIFYVPSFVVLLLYLGLNLLLMVGGATGIAWWGHFAGFLVGLPFAYTLPAVASRGVVPSAKGLPDPERLAPFATTRELRDMLERIRQFTPETRTADDASYANAWVDKFFAKATCAQGHAFTRDGPRATCAGGETVVEFARK